jgi:predicted nucleic acid-binding protein
VKIVVDAFAWVEFFIGNAKGKRVKEILEEADEVYTPDTVVAEVARKYLREGAEPQTVRSRLEVIAAASTVNPIDTELALEAAKCFLKLSREAKKAKLSDPSLSDAIALASARLLGAKVLTSDEHFKGQPETLWLE